MDIEVVSKEIKEHPYWRIGVMVFGVGLSVLTAYRVAVSNCGGVRAIDRHLVQVLFLQPVCLRLTLDI